MPCKKKQLLTRRKRLRYAFNRFGIWNYKKSVNGYKNSLFPSLMVCPILVGIAG